MFATPLASCAQRAQSSNAICRSKFERLFARVALRLSRPALSSARSCSSCSSAIATWPPHGGASRRHRSGVLREKTRNHLVGRFQGSAKASWERWVCRGCPRVKKFWSESSSLLRRERVCPKAKTPPGGKRGFQIRLLGVRGEHGATVSCGRVYRAAVSGVFPRKEFGFAVCGRISASVS
jgi:hypothetical protein